MEMAHPWRYCSSSGKEKVVSKACEESSNGSLVLAHRTFSLLHLRVASVGFVEAVLGSEQPASHGCSRSRRPVRELHWLPDVFSEGVLKSDPGEKQELLLQRKAPVIERAGKRREVHEHASRRHSPCFESL